MSNRSLVRPLFPNAPIDYDRVYQEEVVRAFSVFLQQLQNPGDARHTTLTLTALQSDDQGLEIGALFQVDGFVKITQANTPHVAGVGSTGSAGSVTVTTT